MDCIGPTAHLALIRSRRLDHEVTWSHDTIMDRVEDAEYESTLILMIGMVEDLESKITNNRLSLAADGGPNVKRCVIYVACESVEDPFFPK